MRVAECRLAAMLLAKALGTADVAAVRMLCQVEGLQGRPLQHMPDEVRVQLHEAPYTRAELRAALGAAPVDAALAHVPADVDCFRLRPRALHVFEEYLRVRRFAAVCSGAVAAGEDSAALREAGELMNASHDSCARLFDCSCPELDCLVAACRAAGALGVRAHARMPGSPLRRRG